MKASFIVVAAVVVGLTGCQATQTPRTATTETPDEQHARAICQDGLTSDAAYGGGAEGWIRNCMQQRLREIRAGLR